MVHRDIKLQNLLLTTSSETPTAGLPDVKLADFGLAALLEDLEVSDRAALKAYDGLTDRWGTPQYFAPEIIDAR